MKNIVALIGKPNVGKSTLFNKLVGKKVSIIHDSPGVTRDRIYSKVEWAGKEFYLIDTGGIEIENKSFQEQIRIQTQIAIKEPTSNTEQILQGIQKIVSEFLTKHFKNPQLVGILMYVAVGIVFVLGLINYLVIRKRLANINIDAVFGQVYRREIDIDRIRSKRHFICFVVYFVLILFPVVIVVLLLRKRRAKK